MCLRTTSGAAIVALLLSAPALGAEPKDSLGSTSQPRELRITVQTPPGSINNDNLELFKKRVETATDGALKISVHVGLVEDSQVIKAVAAGQVEMGGSRIGLFADAVPAIGIFLLPFMFNLLPVQDAAIQTDSPFSASLGRGSLGENRGSRPLVVTVRHFRPAVEVRADRVSRRRGREDSPHLRQNL